MFSFPTASSFWTSQSRMQKQLRMSLCLLSVLLGACTLLFTQPAPLLAEELICPAAISDCPQPPIAYNDNAVTQVNTPVDVDVLDNDSNGSASINIYSIDLDPQTAGQQNTKAIEGKGTFRVDYPTLVAASTDVGEDFPVTFTPDTDFIGTATATYTVEDIHDAVSNVATITVRVNAPPVAVNDSEVTQVNTPVTFNVESNDNDNDGTINPFSIDLDPLTAGQQTTFIAAGEGMFSMNNLPPLTAASTNDAIVTVTFTPTADFVGTSTISYTVKDNDGGISNAATISVRVNAPPVAVDDSKVTQVNTPVTFNVVSNDNDNDGTINPFSIDLDPLTAGQQTTFIAAGEGTFSMNNLPPLTAASTNDAIVTVTFTPTADFVGTSTISYTVKDNDGGISNAATISVRVNAPPVAVDDSKVTQINTPVDLTVTDNDSDSDGSVNAYTVDLDPQSAGQQSTFIVAGKGTFSVKNQPGFAAASTNQPPGGGTITFTPAMDFTGTVTATYTVNDDDGALSNTATITVEVNDKQNQPPTIESNQRFTVAENSLTGTAIGTVVATDSDKGDTLTFAIAGEADVSAAESIAETMGDSNFAINATTGELSVAGAQLDYEVRTTYVLTIEVTDDGNPTLSARNAVTVQVTNVNEAPVVNNPPQDQEAQAGEVYSFTLPADTFSEQDLGDTLTFTATLEGGSPLPAWLTFNSSTRTFSGTPPADASGTITVQVTATDTNGTTASDTFAIRIGLDPTNLNAEEEPTRQSHTIFLPTVTR